MEWLSIPIKKLLVDVAVGWANGSIVNPTLMPSSVDYEKHATQLTPLPLI